MFLRPPSKLVPSARNTPPALTIRWRCNNLVAHWLIDGTPCAGYHARPPVLLVYYEAPSIRHWHSARQCVVLERGLASIHPDESSVCAPKIGIMLFRGLVADGRTSYIHFRDGTSVGLAGLTEACSMHATASPPSMRKKRFMGVECEHASEPAFLPRTTEPANGFGCGTEPPKGKRVR
ncbi:hypothetical protein BDW22DRAFT_1200530 [Trametopsis cervina]|nr:hypothetical protein BDW22DRAFT_1200530 [Trametopsis cervina]